MRRTAATPRDTSGDREARSVRMGIGAAQQRIRLILDSAQERRTRMDIRNTGHAGSMRRERDLDGGSSPVLDIALAVLEGFEDVAPSAGEDQLCGRAFVHRHCH